MLGVVYRSVVWQMCVTVYYWCDQRQCCVTSVCAGCDIWQRFMTACDCGPLVWPVAVLRDQSLCDFVHIWHDLWQCCVTVSTFDMTYKSVVWLCLHLTWPVAVLYDRCYWVCIWHDPWQCCVTSVTVSTFDMTCGCVVGQVRVTMSTFDMTHGRVVWQVLPCLHLTWHVAVLWDKCVLLCRRLHEE